MSRTVRKLALSAILGLTAAPAAANCHLWMQFDFGSAVVDPEGRALLDKVAALYPASSYAIIGHADAPGTEFENLVISRARTEAVASYLAGRGVAGVVSQTAKAQTELLEFVHGPARINRRVSVQVSPCSEPALLGS